MNITLQISFYNYVILKVFVGILIKGKLAKIPKA